MTEEWRIIVGFEDYAASSLGRIKRVTPDKLGRYAGKIMSPKLGWHGYMEVGLTRDKKQITLRVNRLVCTAFHGNPTPEAPQSAHKNWEKHRQPIRQSKMVLCDG